MFFRKNLQKLEADAHKTIVAMLVENAKQQSRTGRIQTTEQTTAYITAILRKAVEEAAIRVDQITKQIKGMT